MESDVESAGLLHREFAVALTPAYAEERREIREEYRKLLAETSGSMEDLNISTVNADVGKANELVEKVFLPREGTFDSSLMNQCSEIVKKKGDIVQTGPQFSAELYAKRLIAFMKNINPVDVTSDTTATLTPENWKKLSVFVAPCFKRAPGFTYLYGAFPETQPAVKKVEKQKREKMAAADRVSAVVMPKEISEHNIETDEQRTARKIKIIREYLNVAYEQTGGKPISYYDFIINPTSFGKTVENMFYFTFLLKDGLATFRLDENKLPHIEPTSPAELATQGRVESNHIITSITWDQWEKLIELFSINEAFFDLGE